MNHHSRKLCNNLSVPFTRSGTRQSLPAKETLSNRRENHTKIVTKQRPQTPFTDNLLPQRGADNTSQSPSGKDVKMSQNIILRSRYCQKKMTNPEYCNKSSGALFQTGRGPSAKSATQCDVAFLRTLLALNKKEEFILNKKLARILGEEEFGSCTQRPDVSGRALQRSGLEHSPEDDSNSISSAETESNRKSFIKYQYDLNGRRIFTDDDDDERKYRIQPKSLRSKTWINTTTVIETKSDMSCDLNGKITSKRKSLTVINLPAEHNTYQEEESDDELQPMKPCQSEREAEPVESSLAWPQQKAVSQGDGVQNVVVHCCQVAQQETTAGSKRSVAKVWHFNEVKHNNCDSHNDKTLDDSSRSAKKGKTKTLQTNCPGAASGSQCSRRRNLRSNTIC